MNTLPNELIKFDQLPDAAHVSLVVVEQLYGKSTTSIWRDVKAGIVPTPRKFGRSTRWNVGDLRRALSQGREEA